MTVKELITELQTFDADSIIVSFHDEYGNSDVPVLEECEAKNGDCNYYCYGPGIPIDGKLVKVPDGQKVVRIY